MQDDEPNNLHQPATKADLHKAITDVEGLLADQANVILEAVNVKLDKKFGEVMKGIDAVMKEVQAHREEDVAGAAHHRCHDDELQDHERRLKALELQPQH